MNTVTNINDSKEITVDYLETEIKALQENIEEAEERDQELCKTYDDLQDDIDNIKDTVKDADRDMEAVSDQLQKHDRELGLMKTKATELTEALEILKQKQEPDPKLTVSRFRRYLDNSGYDDSDDGYGSDWFNCIKLVIETEAAFIYIYSEDEPDVSPFTINRFYKTFKVFSCQNPNEEVGDFEGDPVDSGNTLEEATAKLQKLLSI